MKKKTKRKKKLRINFAVRFTALSGARTRIKKRKNPATLYAIRWDHLTKEIEKERNKMCLWRERKNLLTEYGFGYAWSWRCEYFLLLFHFVTFLALSSHQLMWIWLVDHIRRDNELANKKCALLFLRFYFFIHINKYVVSVGNGYKYMVNWQVFALCVRALT